MPGAALEISALIVQGGGLKANSSVVHLVGWINYPLRARTGMDVPEFFGEAPVS
jgi:hypothetical protein